MATHSSTRPQRPQTSGSAGAASNGYSLILEGIGANDKVVTDGSLLLERVLASTD